MFFYGQRPQRAVLQRHSEKRCAVGQKHYADQSKTPAYPSADQKQEEGGTESRKDTERASSIEATVVVGCLSAVEKYPCYQKAGEDEEQVDSSPSVLR
jgi:hypothetical protein